MKKPPFIRSAYNYDMDEASDQAGLKCLDKSLAQQEFAEESNINYIAERYGLTGEMPQVLQMPQYGDFTGHFDFQEAQNYVRASIEAFMTLPAKMRARFDNDPQKLLTFLDDPENRAEAIAIGLVKPPEAPTASAAPEATKGAPSPEVPPEATKAAPKSKKTDTE